MKILGWNINGKCDILNNQLIKNYFNNFDIIFLCEMHAICDNIINNNMFYIQEFPDLNCNLSNPRGGCAIMIKKNLRHCILAIKKCQTDFLKITFSDRSSMLCVYIPPIDSIYYNEQIIAEIGSEVYEHENNKVPLYLIGDLNMRFGDLNLLPNRYRYTVNPDQIKNTNGNMFIDLILNTFDFAPVNHMIRYGNPFGGNYTFERGNRKSQIDWLLVNTQALKNVKYFSVEQNCPDISDHKPILTEIKINCQPTLETLYKYSIEMGTQLQNHSNIRQINKEYINFDLFKNMLTNETDLMLNDITLKSEENIAKELQDNIIKIGKICKLNENRRMENHLSESNIHSTTSNFNYASFTSSRIRQMINIDEERKWNFVMNSNDNSEIWKNINFNGEINHYEQIENYDPDKLADVFCEKSKINISEIFFEEIKSDINNVELDSEITNNETLSAASDINNNSKTFDGISGNILKSIINIILPILLILFNRVFKGGIGKFPKNVWKFMMIALPKKGILRIPDCVRGITISTQIYKIYNRILTNRIYKFLKIPLQQTAYQNKKSCANHVMSLRILKCLAKKSKKTLFFICTDFKSAFDLVSKKKLFQKLVALGVSMVMLEAIKAIYLNSMTCVFHNGNYSRTFTLMAGIRQGEAISGLLYIAYTMDLIQLFLQNFPMEEIIENIHLLMHADDIMLIATNRSSAERKLNFLLEYCKNNFIYLQIKKCTFLCINKSNDLDETPFEIDSQYIKSVKEQIYLGSTITNSTNIRDDVEAENANRNKNIIKYYAFLRKNRNAPLKIKLRVLEACVMSSILYNCETWGNVCLKKLDNKFRRLLKTSLNISINTCNEICYIETGMPSISCYVKMRQLNFWNKIQDYEIDDPLRKIIQIAKHENINFIKYYENLKRTFHTKEEIKDDFFRNLKSAIYEKMLNGRSKYVTYLKINPDLVKPTIYDNIYNNGKRTMIAKLRTITHDLMIEMGRRTNTPPENRICLCENNIETEEHFLCFCPLYHNIRQNFNIQNQSIETLLSSPLYINYISAITSQRKLIRERYQQ